MLTEQKKRRKLSGTAAAAALCILYILGRSASELASVYIGHPKLITILFLGLIWFDGLMITKRYLGQPRKKEPAQKIWKDCCYFLPLPFIASVNLWGGIYYKLGSAGGAVPLIISLIMTGIAEEILYRKIVLQILEKEDPRYAASVSAFIFGISHLVNLINGSGMSLYVVICQVIYASALGYLFAVLTQATGSVVPAAVTHAAFNLTGFFSQDTRNGHLLLSTIVITAVAVSYAMFVSAKRPLQPDRKAAFTKKVLLGIAAGDIAGSKWEFLSIPEDVSPDTMHLLEEDSFYTDDTVLAFACRNAADRIREAEKELPEEDMTRIYAQSLRRFARIYPDKGYGGRFWEWACSDSYRKTAYEHVVNGAEIPTDINCDDPVKPAYGSIGNGSAMRSGVIGAMFDDLQSVITHATCSAMPTHNSRDGVVGAVVTAVCVWMAIHGRTKDEIRNYLKDMYPATEMKERRSCICGETKLEELLKMEKWQTKTVECRESVLEAVVCFLDTDSFEGFLRAVMKIDCDRDTVAAIGGGIAAAFYENCDIEGVPLKDAAPKYLPPHLCELL